MRNGAWRSGCLGWAAVALTLVAVGLSLVWTPMNPHPIHSAGATQITPLSYPMKTLQRSAYFGSPQTDESLEVLECATWQGSGLGRGQTCDPADPSWRLFPTASQSPHTLYLTWYGCVDWHGSGAIVPWQGYNFEYLPGSRTVVVHCYRATPYVYIPQRLYGVAALFPPDLYAIPDGAFGAGKLTINEDDRLEHIVGDQTWDDFQLATATVS